MAGPTRLLYGGGLVAAGLLGSAFALGGAALLGGFDDGTTTVSVQTPPVAGPISLKQAGTALTVNQIFRRAAPGVVQVTATQTVTSPSVDPFFGLPTPSTQQAEALGSGFVIDKAGHIVTNYHVVEGAKSVDVSFSNNESRKAKVVGVDPSTDIAVLQVDAHARALTPLPLGNSDSVHVGDSVVAIGNPFGYDRTVTTGIVSALQRVIQAPNSYSIDHVIQTDAALNKGNSGGPLLDARGEVIGVNSQISTGGSGTSGNVGIGFAVPINTVRTVAAQLISSGHVNHAYIGITAQPVSKSAARLFHLPVSHGLLVAGVQSGSGAAKAGLRAAKQSATLAGETYPLGGDLIASVDGTPLYSIDQLRDAIANKQPGDDVKLGVYRGSDKRTVTVTLGRQPTTG
ncbi:MAG TPA: trypsin-like peptidase domain-containing protein [Candidatus Binatia bacterium]|jgi:S1-C subfamily serine protease|nr:trypsin-like peptidase domain-containing protein [Candidatus Binatia bacterium]